MCQSSGCRFRWSARPALMPRTAIRRSRNSGSPYRAARSSPVIRRARLLSARSGSAAAATAASRSSSGVRASSLSRRSARAASAKPIRASRPASVEPLTWITVYALLPGPTSALYSFWFMRNLYIAGTWVPASDGGTAETINPFDASVLDTTAEATAADVDGAVTAAREAFGSWRRTTVTERAALLNAIADLLQRDRESLARTESLDTGKTLNEAGFDVDDSTAVFRYYAALCTSSLSAGRVVDPGRANVVSRIVHEPVGVCALIAPWNYPLLQISWKLAPALAAGNTAVIKPSEVTPLSTVALVALAEEAGAPPGVVNLVLGAGAVAGACLVQHPSVDLISFTGGLATGERIMAAAARGVRRVALELGGKNPNIVFADTDFDTVVDNALTAAFLHSGQVCSAGARLIVQDRLHDSFVSELAARADRIRLGSGLDAATECGPLVSAAQRAKVERYVA